MKGKFIIDGEVWPNHIMDQGVKKLMKVISDNTETDNLLLWLSLGASSDNEDDTTLTRLNNELSPSSKLEIGSFTVNSVYPFDLELRTTIGDDIIRRPRTIHELGVWWGPENAKELFARAVNPTGKVLEVGQAIPITYSLTLV